MNRFHRLLSVGLLGIAVGCAGSADSSPSSVGSKSRDGLGDGETPGSSAGAVGAPGSGTAPTLASAPAPTGSFASASTPGTSAAAPSPSAGAGMSAGGAPAPSGSGASSIGVSVTGGGNGSVAAGTLTSGAWDDNRNFDRFLAFRSEMLKQSVPGMLPTTNDEHQRAYDLYNRARGARQTLDIALVIDTTGSMGDEIKYLQSELLAISASIESRYPNAEQRWSLVAYKDEGDVYVVRWFDFRNDAMEFRDKLAAQSADGGGDFPEAPDQALATMAQLAWRTDANTARLAFWVADAPHHPEKAQAMADAIRAARAADIHVYPVASSGIDDLTELTMRTAAQLSLGRYLFLTDDSGVGGEHKEPRIPCYFVTHLDDAIVRMVDVEMSGEYHEPAASEIIRKGGDPQSGACTLAGGDQARAF